MSNDFNDEDLLKPGAFLNNRRYRIVRKLGQGGFGITYFAKAIAPGTGDEKDVVIKELFYKDFCARDQHTQRVTISVRDKKVEFEKLVKKQVEEGRTLSRLNHPNIVNNVDIFEENDTAYIVMDYLSGTDLGEILSTNGKLQPDLAIKYLIHILNALQHTHDRKIMHLDIKPSNIFIRDRRVVKQDDGTEIHVTDDTAILIDFGASLSYDDHDHVKGTTSELISGISSYAPLEQRAGIDNLKTFAATLDTFTAGGTLYHCLTGQMPPAPSFRVSNDDALIPPTSYPGNELMSPLFNAVCEKGLAIRIKDRYATAAEFADSLKKLYTPANLHALYVERAREMESGTIMIDNEVLGMYMLADAEVKGTAICTEKIAFYRERIANQDKAAKRKQFDQLLSAAQGKIDKGMFTAASEDIKAALMIFPEDEQAKHLKIDVDKRKNRSVFLKKLEEAKTLMSQRKYPEALSAITEALEFFPEEIYAQELQKEIQAKIAPPKPAPKPTPPTPQPKRHTEQPVAAEDNGQTRLVIDQKTKKSDGDQTVEEKDKALRAILIVCIAMIVVVMGVYLSAANLHAHASLTTSDSAAVDTTLKADSSAKVDTTRKVSTTVKRHRKKKQPQTQLDTTAN